MPKPGSDHITTGISGEDAAARYLAGRGFRLLARNWRPRGRSRNLELDLVGIWEKTLVFVEVKTRRTDSPEAFDGPAGLRGFTASKQRSMVRAARAYLAEQEKWDAPCRFDLVCVTLSSGKPPKTDHFSNVIELGQTLDSGDAAWQPW